MRQVYLHLKQTDSQVHQQVDQQLSPLVKPHFHLVDLIHLLASLPSLLASLRALVGQGVLPVVNQLCITQ